MSWQACEQDIKTKSKGGISTNPILLQKEADIVLDPLYEHWCNMPRWLFPCYCWSSEHCDVTCPDGSSLVIVDHLYEHWCSMPRMALPLLLLIICMSTDVTCLGWLFPCYCLSSVWVLWCNMPRMALPLLLSSVWVLWYNMPRMALPLLLFILCMSTVI